MFFPESLYLLSDRDLQVTWLDPLFLQVPAASAATQVTASYRVPEGRALLLQSGCIQLQAGAGQTSLQAYLRAQPPTGGLESVIRGEYFTATANWAINWAGSIIIPPNWDLVALGVFNAAAAVNNLTMYAQGMLIPVGNLQRL